MEKALKRAINVLNANNASLANKIYTWGRSRIIGFLPKIEALIPNNATKILDIGCGSGLTSLYFHFKKPSRGIIGYDINSYRIKNLQRAAKRANVKNVTFITQDLTQDSDISQADTVLFIDLLHHVPFKTQVLLIKKAYSKTAKNGKLIIKEIEKNHSYKYYFNFVQDKLMTRGDALFFRSRNDWVSLLKNSGYIVEKSLHSNSVLYPHLIIVARKP